MAIYSIGDLHLSFAKPKPMDIFGDNWEKHEEKIEENWYKIVKNCPFILVGSKQDLESEREVSYSDAKALADSWGCEYIETSAKLNYNCDEIFEKSGKLILNKRNDKSNTFS